MRDLDNIDAELRLIAVVRDANRSGGGTTSSVVVDRLLDERSLMTDG